MLTTVVFDVGETLVDETPSWTAWAQWLGVPPFTLYRRIAERAGVSPQECVHVGDRLDNDVVAARAAGMTAIHLRRGPRVRPRRAEPVREDDRMPFTVTRDTRASATVLAVQGELDLATAKVLRSEVEQALAASPPRLYLDLSATSFIDSSGCRELVHAAKNGGVPVELVVPPKNWRVRRVIDFMQLGELLPVHDELPTT